MSPIGTVTAVRPESSGFSPGFNGALGTRLALALLADNDALGASGAPASPQSVPAIPLETGADFTTLFTVRFAAALRAATRRRDQNEQRSKKRGSSW